MANRKSQEQISNWNYHEDTLTNEYGVTFDSTIDFSENLQSQIPPENVPDIFSVQDSQTLGIWPFQDGAEPCKFI